MKPDQNENSDSLYLNQLKYKPEDGKTFLNFFIKNFRVIILIIIGLIGWGAISFNSLPLESNPEVKIPFGSVSVGLPGASPADVEELIIKKIEPKIVNLAGVKQVSSTALNSFAAINVEFRPEENIKDAISRLRDAVDKVKTDLPAEATDPVVNEVSFSNSPVWTLVVTGPYDNFTLRKYAEIVQKELEKLPGTNSVTIGGGDIAQIRVIYDPAKLQQYGLSADQINGTIKANNLALPLGTMAISNFEYLLRSEGKFTNAAELRTLPISGTGTQIIRLQDVATVAEMAADRDTYSRFSYEGGQPQNSVALNVTKKTGSSIIELIDGGKKQIATLLKEKLPENLKIETTLDISKIIRRDFDELWRDGILTIFLVTLVLFLFVGLKEAFVAGLAVPLVFCSTFGLMALNGISLNFLSLFSLILSLGLLVDDAIVVVQATKQYLKTGKFTPEEAVLLVFRDFKVLLFTTTLTTIWAFIPLLMATGIIGQFIRSIPITVSVTLAASFFIAIIINHPMAIILERFRVTTALFKAIMLAAFAATAGSLIAALKGAGTAAIIATGIFGVIFFSLLFWYRRSLKQKLLHNEDMLLQEMADPAKIKAKIYHHYLATDSEKSFISRLIGGIIKIDKILPRYGKILYGMLQSKLKSLLVLGLVALLFIGSVALPATGILKSEFLPPNDSEYMYINIEGAPGLALDKTKAVAEQVEKVLLNEKTIISFTEIIGSSGVNLSSVGRGTSAGGGQTNRAQFAINFYPFAQRPATGERGKVEKSYEIAPRLRKAVEPIQGAKVTVMELAGGPPSGSDFEGRIMGDDLQVLEREVNKYKDLLSSIPGTVNVKTSLVLSPGEFTFKLNPEQMQIRGLSSAQVASTLRTAISGSDVTKILRDGDELQVVSEFSKDNLKTIDDLKALTLVNGRGTPYMLSDIAEISLGSALTSISRIDEKRVVVLTAGVEKPALPGEVQKKFEDLLKQNPLPEGYEIKFGGQTETNTESILSILRAMVVAMLLIIATLVIQFNSFRKAVLVLAAIPLAMTGVFYGLTLIHFSLSFPGLIGVLALFGVVVKNAVILVDKINLNLRVGIPFTDAIVDASKSRLEAIFLTSVCTIIGMMPITVANETWEGLGASLIFGLASSTFLTLFVIPILFQLFMKKSSAKAAKLAELRAQMQ